MWKQKSAKLPSSRRSKRAYGTPNLESRQARYIVPPPEENASIMQNLKFQFGKTEFWQICSIYEKPGEVLIWNLKVLVLPVVHMELVRVDGNVYHFVVVHMS
jgi:hypothetical protein